MTALLRHHMQRALGNWRDDLSPEWRTFFGEAEPDFDAVPAALTYDDDGPVIPPRKGAALDGAPVGAHIFRAFDGLAPRDVRVLVVGQDPYPNRARATGRAFEDGALTSWSGSVAVSLKHLMQSALALRLNRPELAANDAAWAVVRQDVQAGRLSLEGIADHFDRLQLGNGVQFVNAGWTLTRFRSGGGPEQVAHIAMWRPVMTRLLRGLAERPDAACVYLLLGKFAQDLFDASGVEVAARRDGAWGVRVVRVDHPHPNAPRYFQHPNPLARVNAALEAMTARPVDW